MFRSYEPGRDGYVTLVANYLPLQDPYGGPNYFKLDPNAVYEIHVTNDGGAVENLTFQFRFQNTLRRQPVHRRRQDGVDPAGAERLRRRQPRRNSPALNVHENYTLDVIRGAAARRARRRRSPTSPQGGTTLRQAGRLHRHQDDRRTTSPTRTSTSTRSRIPGCSGTGRVFVGQRKDPFVVNLGETFDLVNIKYPAVELNPLAEFATVDSLADANVTVARPRSADRVPDRRQGRRSSAAGPPPACPATRTRRSAPPAAASIPTSQTGSLVQVSRLGMPLVNEVVIGLKDKNKFNASEPKDDGQFADYVTNPTLPTLLEVLFGGAGVKAPTNFPRTDLVAAFLTGVDGLEQAGQRRGVRAAAAQHVDRADAGRHRRTGSACSAATTRASPTAAARATTSSTSSCASRWACCARLEHSAAARRPTRRRARCSYTDGAYISSMFFANEFPYLRAPLKGSPNDDNAIQ